MSIHQNEDLFEFVDYTSVSNFERLVTFLEDVLISWEVKDGLYGVFSDDHLASAHAALTTPSAATFTRQETFTQDNDRYTFTYHCYPTTATAKSGEDNYYHFLDQHHALHRWTGKRRFLLLSGPDPKQLISACAIAFQNTGCTVPVFVPIGQPKHQMFIGYMLVSDQPGNTLNEMEMRYNMALSSSMALMTLEGLMHRFRRRVEMYRDEIGGDDDQETITASIAYTFSLKNWFDEHWKEGTRDNDDGSWDIKTLPFGSYNDPLRELSLTILFPFSEDFNENGTFQITLNNHDQDTKWLLSREFAPKSQQRAFLSSLLGQVIQSWMTDPSSHLDRHVGLMHSFLTAVQSRNTEPDQVTVIRSEQVEGVMSAIFDTHVHPISATAAATQKLALSIKSPSVPCGSLSWNTLFYSLEALSGSKNTSAIGFLKIVWTELLKKIRWHWEHLVLLPDIEMYDKEQTIDLRFNIIHQKLVMINSCIQRKKKDMSNKKDEEDTSSRGILSSSSSFAVDDDDDDDSSSDIFYDSIQDDKPDTTLISESFIRLPYTPGTDIDPYSSHTYDDKVEIKDPEKIEGVLCTHPSLKLLETDKPMNIPITQEPGLMTLDMLELQAQKFESLGSSDNATQLRAKLQSAQLCSDMQAFKAANPQACLQDFVRWHSPRDWVDGQLSARMSESNNIWQELWKCSKRIPSSRQRPLFDVDVEAEKALSDLEGTSIHEFFAIMLSTMGLIVYDSLAAHPIVKKIPPVSLGITRLEAELTAFRWNDFCEGKVSINSILNSIRQQESMMCYAISLLRKLPKQYNLVSKLLLNIQDSVEQDEKNAVFQLFKNEHDVIAEPSFREYVVSSEMKLNDRCLPLRQYALVKDNEVRIIDMHTTDALFT
ncbi:hypothetical protein K501DRAFT_337164 [Backusella circina FSU 941]|nr:hypothetical protein K501DRAFT_337164 [Backusella circina FSU 941]